MGFARGAARRLVRLALAVTFAVHVVLAAVVYRDARGRDASGIRWAVVTLTTGLVGAAGYVRVWRL